MTYDEILTEIPLIYRDYDYKYAYGFINGMVYASRVSLELTSEQMRELNKLNLQTHRKNGVEYDY